MGSFASGQRPKMHELNLSFFSFLPEALAQTCIYICLCSLDTVHSSPAPEKAVGRFSAGTVHAEIIALKVNPVTVLLTPIDFISLPQLYYSLDCSL